MGVRNDVAHALVMVGRNLVRYARSPQGVAFLGAWVIATVVGWVLIFLTGSWLLATAIQLVIGLGLGWVVGGVYTRTPEVRHEKAAWEREQ